MNNDYIKSPLNYTGGKHKLLPQLMPLFPTDSSVFIDIFCGGANVGVNSNAPKVIYNDANSDLIGLLKTFKKNDYKSLVQKIEKIISQYELSDSTRHGYAFYGCNSGEGLGAYNRPKYLALREDFNKLERKNEQYYLLLFTLIIYAFNNQIRFNSSGEFNLPVGKRDFNVNIRQNLQKFIEALALQETLFLSKDFKKFKISEMEKGSFIYCDPPYLITTASYNEKGGWTIKDERDLLEFLDAVDEAGHKFALSNVTKHKGRENLILMEWAKKYCVHKLQFNYSNSNYHGKDTEKETQEVLITNY